MLSLVRGGVKMNSLPEEASDMAHLAAWAGFGFAVQMKSGDWIVKMMHPIFLPCSANQIFHLEARMEPDVSKR